MNAERCLLAGEALGLGYAALQKYAVRPLRLTPSTTPY